ncbi:hypothetical protein IGB42_01801 [Andreprevotia sp. IGB-42]|uniref:DUF2251 domain-containing protein n=1 Tax=Andreprevotia sp. IGB-42 TaxID=2497473 RepID=UPI00135BAEED|nr:DUF2251 domain-containing protein [Andreprevotia sp. IGB-42]KAF0813450.1 hypothetical protein IGB42_01801 [Andreprevotia sp. IGB-42]
MPIQITAEQEITVGQTVVIEAPAPAGHFMAAFEDDTETGYFYALDLSRPDSPIEDALHIYNVSNVKDKALPSLLKIGWSLDSRKAVLLINGYPHAVFDFDARRGYCRTGFPPPDESSPWGAHSHAWLDEATDLFA